jgi:hypothetical protein
MILGRECSLADAPLEAERELLSTWNGGRVAGRNGVARRPALVPAYLQPSTS